MNSSTTVKLFDPVQVEVWRNLLSAIAEEMGATLERAAYSPNIKERLDHSCALFSAKGELLAQAAHIPVHLGAMPSMMEALRDCTAWEEGDMWLCNDPRFGGTHLPDLTLVAPVYLSPSQLPEIERTTLIGFVASRAHHADVGGLSPGSLPLSSEIYHEGLVVSPVRLMERGALKTEIQSLVCANSRTPNERRGDLAAQIAANETGIRRLQSLVIQQSWEKFQLRAAENIAYAEAIVRNTLKNLPAGAASATDYLDNDGASDAPIEIRVRIEMTDAGEIIFDFTGSAPQVRGSLNATEAITRSACYYATRCLVEEEIPTNAGCNAPVKVIAPLGTVVNARFPAAVAAGNVETSQRIVDVILKALAHFAPERIPSASQGTMNNLLIGGWDSIRQRPFAYYETLAGGAGASPQNAGASAIHTHCTNTRNTPVEALETHYPLRVIEYGIAENTGGEGLNGGGSGLIRAVELLSEAHVSLITERRAFAPYGLNGGGEGAKGRNERRAPDAEFEELPGKFSAPCPAGTIIRIQTPGGGGWGRPLPAESPLPSPPSL